jgi:phage tail-like protein
VAAPLITAPPRTASLRAIYRRSLPAIYQADDLAMRFTEALEEVLDPLVAVIDGLPAYIDPDLAPPDMLRLLAGWVGITLDESWPIARQRELLRRAGRLLQLRGTRAGLELALEIAFPDLPLRVTETGGVVSARSADALPAPEPPEFVVYCDTSLEAPAPLIRLIEQVKPAHVRYRLKIKRAPGEAE